VRIDTQWHSVIWTLAPWTTGGLGDLGNLSHFAVMFRRYVGVSPSIYRAWLQQSRIQGLWGRIYKTLRYALTHAPLLLPFPLEPARVVV
jgi:hypothetical protein